MEGLIESISRPARGENFEAARRADADVAVARTDVRSVDREMRLPDFRAELKARERRLAQQVGDAAQPCVLPMVRHMLDDFERRDQIEAAIARQGVVPLERIVRLDIGAVAAQLVGHSAVAAADVQNRDLQQFPMEQAGDHPGIADRALRQEGRIGQQFVKTKLDCRHS